MEYNEGNVKSILLGCFVQCYSVIVALDVCEVRRPVMQQHPQNFVKTTVESVMQDSSDLPGNSHITLSHARPRAVVCSRSSLSYMKSARALFTGYCGLKVLESSSKKYPFSQDLESR